MNSTEKQLDAAMRRLDSDPALAADFDSMRKRDYPGKTRRESAALGLAALEAKRRATCATSKAKTLRTVAKAAASTFKAAVAAITPRPDKRQGDLPLAQWSFGHLATAALSGDKLATAELSARGYELNSHNTFSKRPS
jgi:hypothetical protein